MASPVQASRGRESPIDRRPLPRRQVGFGLMLDQPLSSVAVLSKDERAERLGSAAAARTTYCGENPWHRRGAQEVLARGAWFPVLLMNYFAASFPIARPVCQTFGWVLGAGEGAVGRDAWVTVTRTGR